MSLDRQPDYRSVCYRRVKASSVDYILLITICWLYPAECFGQTLSPSAPAKEYVRLNGTVVAIENNVRGQTGPAAGYQYVRQLTVNASGITGILVNFPVLFAATVPSLATVANGGRVQNANGYDILFTSDAAGTQKLNWEVESYNPASGAVVYWIQVPRLGSGANTPLYLFYGNVNVTNDQSNRAGTWDSTFTAVYHFAGGSRFASDSTIYANNATVSGPVAGAGQIGTGASFASGGYFSVADSALLDKTTGSWEFWFKDDGPPVVPSSVGKLQESTAVGSNSITPKFVGACAAVLTKADTHDSLNGIGFATCNGALFVQAKSSSAATQTQALYTTKGWHHAAFTFSAGNTYGYYADGASIDSGALIPFTISAVEPFRMGKSLTPAWPDAYIGNLDEVRISNVVRSAAWIAAEHANQANSAAFVTLGAESPH